jgi:hypothetical protein
LIMAMDIFESTKVKVKIYLKQLLIVQSLILYSPFGR